MFENKVEFDRNLIDVVNLKKYFPIRGGLLKRSVGVVKAVDDVTFFIKRGETLGLVGESGCGKTTVGRSIMMLTPPSSGYVFLETPKDIVRTFTELVNLVNGTNVGKMTPEVALAIADKINKMFGSHNCEITEGKKKHFCIDAGKITKAVQPIRSGTRLGSEEKTVRDLAEDAIEELTRRYCINFKIKSQVRKLRGRIQFVFQDPFSSLDPKMLIKNIVLEPMVAQNRYRGRGGASGKKLSKEELRMRTIQLLERVGLNVEHMYRFPHEFSGGQRQRIGIARALSVNPDFVVLDEPTSALDVSVQAQILNMLNQLQKDFGLTFLFISHDLSTIRYMCDRVAVMYLGKIVEYSEKHELFNKPTHPYTEALLSVIPVPDPDLKRDRIILPGDVPSPANPPSGCRFHTRCPLVIDVCHTIDPPLTDRGNEHFVACHVR
ncbi:MAG: ATP-binding cassette domain-containing protein [Candidatus Thermoplasmatota archaeon]|nr:ATP-binding cassette domain-containing protein [Candidatus Thermoplasmatota archaeon]